MRHATRRATGVHGPLGARAVRWAVGVAVGALAVEALRRGRPGASPVARLHGAAPDPDLDPAVAVVNPRSGSADDVTIDGARVHELGEDEDLEAVLVRLADEGARVLGVAGGDGSVRCAARVAADRDLALWVIPGGTLNHFAVALGLDDPDAAVAALSAGHTAHVDLGWAGDELFVNTACLGAYGEIVQRRERMEDRLPKSMALLIAAVVTLWRAKPLPLVVDGRRERVWLVFIGNGAYAGMGMTGRDSVQEGVLDLRVLRARGPFPRAAVIARLLVGRLRGSPWLRQTLVRQVRVEVPAGTPLALDGEVSDAAGAIAFRSAPRAVRVVVPPQDGA